MVKAPNTHFHQMDESENANQNLGQNLSTREKLAKSARQTLTKTLAASALLSNLYMPGEALANPTNATETSAKHISAPEKKGESLENTYIMSANDFKLKNTKEEITKAVSDTLGGIRLTPAELKHVKGTLKTAFNVNGDTLTIKDLTVGKDYIFDLIRQRVVSEKDLQTGGKYAYMQDYFIKGNLNIPANEKYAERLNNLDVKYTLTKVMKDNRHLWSVSKLGVENNTKGKNGKPVYEFGFDFEDSNKLVNNNLQVFNIKGADNAEERFKALEFTYDREATKERVRNNISELGFKFNFNSKTVRALPKFMDHINLEQLLKKAVNWSKETVLELNQSGENDLKTRSRTVLINGEISKELQKVIVEYDDEKVALGIKAPEANKNGQVVHNLLGFDLAFQYTVKHNELMISIPDEGPNGLKAFVDHLATSFQRQWDKTNETDLGSAKDYPGLVKNPYKMGNLVTTKTNPRNITLDLSTGFITNFGDNKNPFLVRTVLLPDSNKQNYNLQFVDDFGRALAGDKIKKDEKSSLSLGTPNTGFKIVEVKGVDQPYNWLTVQGGKGGVMEKSIKTFNPDTQEVVLRKQSQNTILSRIPVQVTDQGASDKKIVGYEYDVEKSKTQVTADHFSHLLNFTTGQDEASLINKGVALGLSDAEIYSKFKELFDAAFQGDDQLEGLIVDGRYCTVESSKDKKTISVNENIPEKVKKIINAMHNYLNNMHELDQIQIIVKAGKETRNLMESIGGREGIGRTKVSGFKDFNSENTSNPGEYTLIGGKGSQTKIAFNVKGNGLYLDTKEIDIEGSKYNLSQDRKKNTLILTPMKDIN